MGNKIKLSGTMIYDPDRGGMKNNINYWCVLQLPADVVRYYQYFMKVEKHIDLCMPAWGAHVSIIRGEKPQPQYLHLWKKYQHKKFTFEYEPIILQHKDANNNGSFYFIDLISDELMGIRAEMGLPVFKHFHFTIGRTYYD